MANDYASRWFCRRVTGESSSVSIGKSMKRMKTISIGTNQKMSQQFSYLIHYASIFYNTNSFRRCECRDRLFSGGTRDHCQHRQDSGSRW